MAYIPTLKTKYKEEILPALMKEYGYKTVMQAPRLKKITLKRILKVLGFTITELLLLAPIMLFTLIFQMYLPMHRLLMTVF